MKKILFSLYLIVLSLSGWSQDSFHFTIKGQLPDSGNDGSYMYLVAENVEDLVSLSTEKPILGRTYVDSAKIRGKQFIFKRTGSKRGELYTLASSNQNISTFVVAEPGEIRVLFKKAGERILCSGVKGTPINDSMTDKILVPNYKFSVKVDSVVKVKGQRFSPKELKSDFLEVYKGYSGFIKTHIGYPAGECFLIMYCPLKAEDQNEIWPQLPERIRQLYNKRIAFVNQALQGGTDSVKVGMNSIDFTLPTLTNETLTLSEVVKGKKLVLLDFWASWCGPCLQEMPELVALYEACKDKGLEIIGVSLDVETEPWKEAVKKNKMSWPQILNQKVGEKNLSEIYGITRIPHAIVIDQSGKIISKGLRGKQLSEKIKQLIE